MQTSSLFFATLLLLLMMMFIASDSFRIHKIENELETISLSPSQIPDIRRELVMLSLPAIAGQAIEPLVQLMETAYIGRLGKVETMDIQFNSQFIIQSTTIFMFAFLYMVFWCTLLFFWFFLVFVGCQDSKKDVIVDVAAVNLVC